MESVLSINQLSKNYGKTKAVSELSLEIPKYSVFGILGPNGSGKTTTLGMVLGAINPSSGSYQWFGEGVQSQLRKRIGAILESPIFYPYLSAEDNLAIVAKIKQASNKQIEDKLRLVNLYDRRKSAFHTYSLGMKQRLAIASALLSEPEVLILDEPTNGLDPQGIADMRNLIKQIAQQGKTIILASHLLDEVEKVCDQVAVLKKGNLLYQGKVSAFLGQKNIFCVEAQNLEQLQAIAHSWDLVTDISQKEQSIWIEMRTESIEGQEINQYFQNKGLILSHLSKQKVSLEEQFLEILKK